VAFRHLAWRFDTALAQGVLVLDRTSQNSGSTSLSGKLFLEHRDCLVGSRAQERSFEWRATCTGLRAFEGTPI